MGVFDKPSLEKTIDYMTSDGDIVGDLSADDFQQVLDSWEDFTTLLKEHLVKYHTERVELEREKDDYDDDNYDDDNYDQEP